MTAFYQFVWLVGFFLLSVACSSPSSNDAQTPVQFASQQNPDFGHYWYAGKAELSHYKLSQAHYGDLNPGEVVLVFVTEDFLTDKQVKLESEKTDKVAATSVLKLNASRRFITGIYDYSLFSSVFTPIQTEQFPHTLKVTTSGQDWCGQTFTQLNFRNNQYQVTARSYFQNEGDENYSTEATLLEDEIWTRLRLNPKTLPLGQIRLIPGTATARLRHQRLEPETAQATIQPYGGADFTGKKLMIYTLNYPASKRTLEIVFENAFPYLIAGWEETYESGVPPTRSKKLTTRAVRTNTLLTDYWLKNANRDSILRKELGVKMDLPN